MISSGNLYLIAVDQNVFTQVKSDFETCSFDYNSKELFVEINEDNVDDICCKLSIENGELELGLYCLYID